MSTTILGISAYYHDSAAAIIRDGHIVAASQEERFTRIKHDPSFPENAIRYCLRTAKVAIDELDYIVFYDKPLLKFERLLETYISYAPKGFTSFVKAMPLWIKEKLYLKILLKKSLVILSKEALCKDDKPSLPPLLFTRHHQSHAASAFYPSPFKNAAVLCLDGVGEWASTSAWRGDGRALKPLWEIHFPHSLGLLYSAFTYYAGFKVNSGEYKLMGLAPYGRPRYAGLIRDNLIDIKDDGSFCLDMAYFNFAVGLTMTSKKFHALFGGPPRLPDSKISQKEMDLASSIQLVTEEIVLRLAQTLHEETGQDYLCLAGGVALNCVANGRLQREGPFKQIWVQPAAGDAGGAVGAALAVQHDYLGHKRNYMANKDTMQGAYLGPHYSTKQHREYLDAAGAHYSDLDDDTLIPQVAQLLAQGKVVAWFQGRMEFGPRALGNRSILGDPRDADMQRTMNLKIKFRESFRPFAPAVKADKVHEWFECTAPSPYMLHVAQVKQAHLIQPPNDLALLGTESLGFARLTQKRSSIPAVTHVDNSARIQTVSGDSNPRFYRLLDEFDNITGCPILVNTSFNVRGEPPVNTTEDAYRCFMNTDIDYLVLDGLLLDKAQQKIGNDKSEWKLEFEAD